MVEPPPLEKAIDRGDYVKAVERLREEVLAAHCSYAEQLPMWVILGPGTSDQPGLYLARLWLGLPETTMTTMLVRAASLREIRDLLPDGLSVIPRMPNDDINIIESWI